MSGIFWTAAVVMVSVAVSFVALPLVKSKRKGMLAAVVVLVPLLAAGVYMKFGSPGVMDDSRQSNAMQGSVPRGNTNASNEQIGSVASLVEGLADRLHENPDDGGSWLLLAKSYQHLHRPDDAAAAYAKAAALGEFDEELAKLGEESPVVQMAGARIRGNIQLSANALALVKPTDTVFVFAKAVGGPAAPVAVLKRAASELPLDFMLSDSQSMVSGVKLSDFETVVVTARITRSGDATEALQGLEARSDPILVADSGQLNLTIQ
jgi:hypothetical protein